MFYKKLNCHSIEMKYYVRLKSDWGYNWVKVYGKTQLQVLHTAVEKHWYQYRDEAYEKLARQWSERHKIDIVE